MYATDCVPPELDQEGIFELIDENYTETDTIIPDGQLVTE